MHVCVCMYVIETNDCCTYNVRDSQSTVEIHLVLHMLASNPTTILYEWAAALARNDDVVMILLQIYRDKNGVSPRAAPALLPKMGLLRFQMRCGQLTINENSRSNKSWLVISVCEEFQIFCVYSQGVADKFFQVSQFSKQNFSFLFGWVIGCSV